MMENNLPYPFNAAFEKGYSIDYKCSGEDHRYIEKLGYKSEMASDCSYNAKGLDGLSLSSYGDWGTLHTSFADDTCKKIFLDMYDKGIIKLWRISAYIKEYIPGTDNTDWNVLSYYYEDGKGWKMYEKERREWVKCDDPLK